MIMRFPFLCSGLIAFLLPLISATALTYKLSPNENACFFTYVENKDAKVAFYFAVRAHLHPLTSLPVR